MNSILRIWINRTNLKKLEERKVSESKISDIEHRVFFNKSRPILLNISVKLIYPQNIKGENKRYTKP